MADVAALRLEGLGTPEVTARQVAERRGRSPGELADELGATIKATADLLERLQRRGLGHAVAGRVRLHPRARAWRRCGTTPGSTATTSSPPSAARPTGARA